MSDPVVEIREAGTDPVRVTITGTVQVGRECDGVILSDPKVSRCHLSLTERDGDVVLVDEGSSNGTFVGGVRVVEPLVLAPGMRVVLGSTELELLAPIAAPSTEPPVATEPPPAAAPGPSSSPAAEPATSPPAAPVRPRAALDDFATMAVDGAAIRFRRGTRGETVAKSVANSFRRARRRLAGLGSEPWGVEIQICLVDPFPDPSDPSQMVTEGTFVDAPNHEIWMVTTPESPPEALERPLALLFGAALPDAEELGFLLEGYGLHVAESPDPDPMLRTLELPPIGTAEGEVGSAMALSFVRYLVDREGSDALLRLVATAQPGTLDRTSADVYGAGIANLEQAWQRKLQAGAPQAKPRQFLSMAMTYIRPHAKREVEMFVYMLLSLAFTTAFPFVFRKLVDTAIPSGKYSQVVSLLLILLVAFVVSLLAGLRRSYLAAYVSGSVVQRIRTQMFERLQSLSAGWFNRHEQGDVLSRFFSDVAVLEAGLSQVLREGLFQVLSLVVSAVVLVTLDPLLAIMVLVGAPLIAVVYRAMSKGALKRSLAVQELTGGVISVTAESYQANAVVRAFGLERREIGRFGRASDRLFRSEVSLQLFGGLFSLSVNMIVTLLRLAVVGVGAWLIIHGDLTIGGLVAFMGVMGEVLSPVAALTSVGQQLQASTGALYRVNEVMDEVPEIADGPAAIALPPVAREIRLEGVGFSYTPDVRTLDNVNCVIPAGSRAAFVGPSGAGKSSILQLLMRSYDPDEGAVLFDGRDIREGTLASLRGQLGVVSQDTFLFDATVRDNIRAGNLDATDAEVESAARAAELHDFVMSLPRGYDTLVGERGGRLSGGQRQRLSIARALLRNPAVLILDEATSALDPRTERLIASTLDLVSQGRTTIAVTHRLMSVAEYDRIFVVAQGQIVEQGTHDELVALGGQYASLLAEQTGGHLPAEPPFDAAAALARIPLFAQLAPDALADVAARLGTLDLASGESMKEGGGRLAIIRTGRGTVLVAGIAGEPEPVAELGPGDCFGLTALLGQERGAELVASERTRLLVLDDETLSSLAARYPSVADALQGSTAAAPVGGARLSRLTIGPRAVFAPPGTQLAPTAPLSAAVRRATGSLPQMR